MDQLNSKVLESLIIPSKIIDIDIKDYEIKNQKVNFFGSNWSTDVYFDLPENRLEEGKKALISFLKKSSSISSKIENWFCHSIVDNPWYPDVVKYEDAPEKINSYKDIPGLTLGWIEVTTTYRTKKIVVCLCGGYDIDYEHGWAIALINNKIVGNLADSGSIHNEYANESMIATEGLVNKIKNAISLGKATNKISKIAFEEVKKMQKSKNLKSSNMIGKEFEKFINIVFSSFVSSPEWHNLCSKENVPNNILSKCKMISNKIDKTNTTCVYKLESCTDDDYKKYGKIINKLLKAIFYNFSIITVKVGSTTPDFTITFNTTVGKTSIDDLDYWNMIWITQQNLDMQQQQMQQQIQQQLMLNDMITQQVIQQQHMQAHMNAVAMSTPGMGFM